MKKLFYGMLIIALLIFIACGENLNRPFDFQRYEKEGYEYVEKYSERFWSGELDSMVNSPETQEYIENLKAKVDSSVFNTNYMLIAYANVPNYDIWYLRYGEATSLIESEYIPSFCDNFKEISDCILEMYTMDAECGGWYRIYYLRRGKQLIPISYSYLPKDIEWLY